MQLDIQQFPILDDANLGCHADHALSRKHVSISRASKGALTQTLALGKTHCQGKIWDHQQLSWLRSPREAVAGLD